jgi:hypothetical protein
LVNENSLYDDPYIAQVGGPAPFRWVWVANGTRLDEEMFAPPKPLSTSGLWAWNRPTKDPTAIDRIIESFRIEAYGLPDDDPWADEDEEEEPRLDLAPPGVFIFTEPAHTSEGARSMIEVRVLGPVEIIGWLVLPDRAIVTELVCFLALHQGRPISGEELRAALRPDPEHEARAKSLRTYMSLARAALGSDILPVGTGAGYGLGPGVQTDWDTFLTLSGPAADAAALRRALELVRGRPFAGVAASTYGWVFSELLVSEMEVAIASASRRLAELALGAGDLDVALWATRQGLLGVSGDLGLWEIHLTAAARGGSDAFTRACRDAEAALGADAADLIGVARSSARS